MDMPKYDGVIEQWKVDLVISRAKLIGFRGHELPDVLQEIVLELLDFKYDPNHAAGAKEQTALTYVIDNHLRKIKRSDTRYRAYLDRMGEGASEFSRDNVDERSLDVASAIAGLTEQEQSICRGLAGGLTKERIANELGCGWHTVNRAVKRLRKHFGRIGLGGWIGQ